MFENFSIHGNTPPLLNLNINFIIVIIIQYFVNKVNDKTIIITIVEEKREILMS